MEIKFNIQIGDDGVVDFLTDQKAEINKVFYDLWQSGKWLCFTSPGQSASEADRFYPYPAQRGDGEFAWKFRRRSRRWWKRLLRRAS